MSKLFHDGGPYHIETSPLICSGFYMIATSIMKWVNELSHAQFLLFLLIITYRKKLKAVNYFHKTLHLSRVKGF